MLEPVGFWSYTRHDDEQSDGALSQLRVIVGKAIALQQGAEVTLWQDVTAIPYGADWAEAIDDTLAKTTFFMPIVTPRYLKSPNCCEEYAAFRRHMSAIGRNDLVFPIHYVAVDKMTVEDTVFGEHLSALRRHQWIDFRGHFYADVRSAEIKKWAGQLAESILSTLRRPAPQARPVGPTGAAEYAQPPVYEAPAPIEYPPRPAAPEQTVQTPPSPPPTWTPPPPPYEPPPEQAAFQPSVYAADTSTQSQAFAGGGYGRAEAPSPWPAYGGPGSPPPSGAANVAPRPTPVSSGSRRPLLIAAATAAGVLGIGGVVFGVIEMRRPAPVPPDDKHTAVVTPPAPIVVPPPPKLPEIHDKGAPTGSPTALTSLGDKYYYGRGVPQDYAKALSYYEKAATAGSGEAMNDVGELYFYGRGVHQDYATAATWYQKAADAGNADGMTNLGSLYDVGYGVTLDHDKAKTWFQKAAAAGNADAMVALGWYYSVGRGVSPDADASAEWYKKAVAAR